MRFMSFFIDSVVTELVFTQVILEEVEYFVLTIKSNAEGADGMIFNLITIFNSF